jgi:SAM-dependent MidA family methyltransferase
MAEPKGDIDYFTSVGVHPIFTEMLARHLDDVWEGFGRPDPFVVVEMAAGDGTLADYLMRVAPEHPWASAINYLGVERSPARQKAAKRLTGAAFVGSLADAGRHSAAAVISNELIDALPFDIARRFGGEWVEECVGIDGDSLAFVDAAASDAIVHYGELYGGQVPEDGRLEMRRGLRDVYSALDQLADRISIATIDYGDIAEQVHSERLSAGTALAFREHRASEELLADPGEQDLTCHVNFTELADIGEPLGLIAGPLVQQADFLANLGIGEYLVHLQSSPGMTAERYSLERKSIMRLVWPSDLGRFRVLVQSRGIEIDGLRGIASGG